MSSVPNNINDSTRRAVPAHLLDAYDDVSDMLYGGQRPRRTVRLDVVTACVESFDWLVKTVAASPYCISDILQTPNDGACKRRNLKNCERCIRSRAYTALLQKKKEESQV